MPFLGELSALLTACLWSVSAIVFASSSRRVGSFTVNITRLILAALYLGIVVVVFGLNTDLSSGQIINLCISGVIGLSLGDTFLFRAFQEIGARVTMLLMSLAPAIAAIMAFFILDETLSLAGIFGILITVLGICIVVFERGTAVSSPVVITTAGMIFGLLAAAGQGAGLVFAKMAFREGYVNGFVATAVRIVASLVVLLPVAFMTKRYRNPLRLFAEDRKAFWLTGVGSVLGPFLGIAFSLIAVANTSVGIAATIMAIVPILMLPLVRIMYKEHLTWRALYGAFIAVGGVAVLFLR